MFVFLGQVLDCCVVDDADAAAAFLIDDGVASHSLALDLSCQSQSHVADEVSDAAQLMEISHPKLIHLLVVVGFVDDSAYVAYVVDEKEEIDT